MELQQVKPGIRVKTTKDEGTLGMMIRQDYLDARRVGAAGTVKNYVAGHGGDVWWVEHDDGSVAPYVFTELEPTAPLETIIDSLIVLGVTAESLRQQMKEDIERGGNGEGFLGFVDLLIEARKKETVK